MIKIRKILSVLMCVAMVATVFVVAVPMCVSSESESSGGMQEIEEMRDFWSKTYDKGDGKYVAEISTSPVHYYDEQTNQFEDIDTTIIPLNENTYVNYNNILKSEFPTTSSKFKKVINRENNQHIEFMTVEMGFCDQGSYYPIQEIQSSSAEVSGSEINYPNVLPQTTEQYIVGNGELKRNYILSSLIDCPEGAESLQFVILYIIGTLDVYVGGELKVNDFSTMEEIELWDPSTNEPVFSLVGGFAYDSSGSNVALSYDVNFESESVMVLRINIPIEWLTLANYPVTVDPPITTALYADHEGYIWGPWPIGTEYYAKHVFYLQAIGYNEAKGVAGLYYKYRPFWRYDTSCIPDYMTITNIEFRAWTVNYHDTFDYYLRHMDYDPKITDGNITWIDCADGPSYAYELFPVGSPPKEPVYVNLPSLDPIANSDLQSQLDEDWFAIGGHSPVEETIEAWGYFYQNHVRVTYEDLRSPRANADGPYSSDIYTLVNFDGTGSYDPTGYIVEYNWDFGDETTGTGETTSHFYSDEGIYTVRLTVIDNEGYSDYDETTATIVGDPPFPDAGGPYVTEEINPITFDGSGSLDDGGIAKYEWDFDDSDGIQVDATGVNPTHIYYTLGFYTVTLKVTDNIGQMQSTTTIAIVITGSSPIADTSGPYETFEILPITFDGTGSTDDYGIEKYEWDFDDSDGIQVDATGVSPTHTYNIPDLYTVTLTVTDYVGQTHTVTTTARVLTTPGPPKVIDLALDDTARVVDYDDGIYVVGTSGGNLYVINEVGDYTITALGAGSINDVRIENGFIAVAAYRTVMELELSGLTPVELWRTTSSEWRQVVSTDLSEDGNYVCYLAQRYNTYVDAGEIGVLQGGGGGGSLISKVYTSGYRPTNWWLDATGDMEYIAASHPTYPPTWRVGVGLYQFDGSTLTFKWWTFLVAQYDVTEVRISENKDYVAAATSSGVYMDLLRLSDGALLWSHETTAKEQYACDGDDNLNYVIGATQAWSPPYPWFVLKNLGESGYEVIAEGQLNGKINDIDSTPDGSYFIFGSDDGTVVMFERTGDIIDTVFVVGNLNLIDATEIGVNTVLVGGSQFINLYGIVHVPNQPPMAEAGGPYTGTEGKPITFDASGSWDVEGDQLQYRWDFDNDGIWDTDYSTNPTGIHIWDGEYSGTVVVEVYDGENTDTDTANVIVILNRPPIADAWGPYFGLEGKPITFDASGSSDLNGDQLLYRWDFDNDGTWDTSYSISSTATHTWGDDYLGTVVMEVYDGEYTDIDTTTITVNNDNPRAGVTGDRVNYILVTNYYSQSYFLGIEEDGSIASPQLIDDKTFRTKGAGIGDFDNDGDADALVGDRYNTWYYEKTGDGNNFAPAVSIESKGQIMGRYDFAEADFNNDGNLDAIMANGHGSLTIYLGNGDGTFTRSTMNCPQHARGLDAGDFNNDGNMDFIGTSYSGDFYGVFIYLGNGDESFQEPILLDVGFSIGVSAGDFNNDGHDDFVAGYSQMKFYPGNGDGTFGPPVSQDLGVRAVADALAESDIDGDGNLDIVYVNGNFGNLHYRKGNGDGTFTAVSSTYVCNSLTGIATLPQQAILIQVNEGDLTPFTGTFKDPGWVDTHTATWNWGDSSPTESGTVTEENEEPFATGDVTGEHAYGDNGWYTVTLTVTDDDSGENSGTATVIVLNLPPVADAGSDQTVDEGDYVIFDGSGTYDPGFLDVLTYTWNFGDGSPPVSDVFLWSPTHVYGDNGVYTVTLTVHDDEGEMSADTMTVTVNNVAPTIIVMDGPIDPVPLGNSITMDAEFIDPGFLDTHTATLDWGDGNVDDLGSVTSHIPQQIHTYEEAGVYKVTLTVVDDDGGIGEGVFRYVVIYDPEGGFVTGGGWIDSPEGAYPADPTLTGKATFGFVSKYKKGAITPTGNTEFQFHAADLNFHSNDYEWLVVAGAKAMFKGTGTINGQGDYKFILTAIDGNIKGAGGVDKFRIKIWIEDEITKEETIIYDNMPGAEDDEELRETTILEGGQIVIHTKGK